MLQDSTPPLSHRCWPLPMGRTLRVGHRRTGQSRAPMGSDPLCPYTGQRRRRVRWRRRAFSACPDLRAGPEQQSCAVASRGHRAPGAEREAGGRARMVALRPASSGDRAWFSRLEVAGRCRDAGIGVRGGARASRSGISRWCGPVGLMPGDVGVQIDGFVGLRRATFSSPRGLGATLAAAGFAPSVETGSGIYRCPRSGEPWRGPRPPTST